MIGRTVLMVATLVLGGAALARSESASLGFRAGLSAPSGDLSKVVGDGFHAGVSMAYGLDSRNAVEVDANYHAFGEKTSTIGVTGFPVTLREKLSLLEGALCIRVLLTPKADRVAPYLKGGFAAEQVRPDLTLSSQSSTFRTSEPDLWLGLLGGAGVSVPFGTATGLTLEGMFHRIETRGRPADLYTVDATIWWKATP